MSDRRPIKILLVDDHAVLRDGLRRILEREPDLEVVGEAHSGESALAAVVTLCPDVVLMDVRMPGMDGIEATRRLRMSHPQAQVLVLSAYTEYAYEALQAGAAGYLTKGAPAGQLLAAVRSVALGTMAIERSLFGAMPWATGEGRRRPGLLTNREGDILRLIARGLTNRTIAHQLGIAPRTADQHVHNLLVKIGVGTRAEAVRYAIEHRLSAGAPAL